MIYITLGLFLLLVPFLLISSLEYACFECDVLFMSWGSCLEHSRKACESALADHVAVAPGLSAAWWSWGLLQPLG